MTSSPRPRPLNLVGVVPSNLRAMIKPRWFAWRNKHIDDHRECDDAHERAVFAAGYLIGGGDAQHLAAQINPAFHDVLRLFILMMTADELTTEQLGQAVADDDDG